MARNRRRSRPNATGRNDTEQYIAISYTKAHSAVWRSLGGPAVKVWVELRSRYNGTNNGDLSLSLDEAARLLHMSKSTAMRAFADLEDKGFLKMMQRGFWYGRKATTWAVTDRPLHGHLATHDYKHWRPKIKARKTDSRYSNETYLAADGSSGAPKK